MYYPSKGWKLTYRHPQAYRPGEPSRATAVGRERQDPTVLGHGHTHHQPVCHPALLLGCSTKPQLGSWGYLPTSHSPSPFCITSPAHSWGPHWSPATYPLGTMSPRKQGIWSGRRMRNRAPTFAQNSWHWVQHHLHGHCRRLGSTLGDPAAGSSPRCQVH